MVIFRRNGTRIARSAGLKIPLASVGPLQVPSQKLYDGR